MSITNGPGEGFIEIITRVRDTEYKNALMNLRPGELVDIEGPYGQFTLHEDKKRAAFFIAGGIGIAPALSIVRSATKNKLPHRLFLLYSGRAVQETPYIDELRQLRRSNKYFDYRITITGDSSNWKDLQGRINGPLIQSFAGQRRQPPVYYVAGLPDMVADIKNTLLDLGTPWEDIIAEDFAGY